MLLSPWLHGGGGGEEAGGGRRLHLRYTFEVALAGKDVLPLCRVPL